MTFIRTSKMKFYNLETKISNLEKYGLEHVGSLAGDIIPNINNNELLDA